MPKPPRSEWAAVEADLLAGCAQHISLAQARCTHLAAWAYYTAAPGSPLRRDCAADFAADWKRFQAIHSKLEILIAGWSAAAIEAIAFKGFPLALLFYPHPALRFFGDVDLYLRPQDVARALQLLPAGWTFVPIPQGIAATHGIGALYSDDLQLTVDLHSSLLPRVAGNDTPSRWLGAKVWAASQPHALGRGLIRIPSPTDLILVGLAINRGLGGDHWRPKAHDYLDISYLHQKTGITESEIEQRARALGFLHTWRAYARACDPYRKKLHLIAPRRSAGYRLLRDLQSMFDAHSTFPRLLFARLGRAPAFVRDICRTLPTMLRVIRDSRLHGGPTQIVNTQPWPRARGLAPWQIALGVNRAQRLLAPLLRRVAAGPCVIRSITAYRLLAAEGHRPEWVCGFRARDGAQALGHAWVELHGTALPGFNDEIVRRGFRETARISAMTPPASGE